jgi:hypothetical protein
MERITIGKCTICGSLLYMCIDGDRYILRSECRHRGVLKFIKDMAELDPQSLRDNDISE